MIIFFCQYFIIRFPGSLRAGLDLLTSHAMCSHDMTVMVDLSKSRRNLAFELLKIYVSAIIMPMATKLSNVLSGDPVHSVT